MATGTYTPYPRFQLFDSSGNPLSSGTLETYAAGTTTALATYSDSTLLTANPTTITLNSAGCPQVSSTEVGIFLTPGISYKFIGKNSAGATQFTRDNVAAVPFAAGDTDVTATAGEALTAGNVAYLSDGSGSLTAGRWYKADADFTYASTSAGMVGIVVGDIASAGTGTVRLIGRTTGLSGLTAGTPYYISATAGALTATVPANGRFLGVADSTTTLVLAPNPARAPMQLLYANSGTDTAAGATTVDSFALSGLTAKDTLAIYITMQSVTQATATPLLRHVTDASNIANLNAGVSLAASDSFASQMFVRQNQSGNTSVSVLSNGVHESGGAMTARPRMETTVVTTAWTGSWSLGLRHGGVTAGGTFKYSWSVYKVAGQ